MWAAAWQSSPLNIPRRHGAYLELHHLGCSHRSLTGHLPGVELASLVFFWTKVFPLPRGSGSWTNRLARVRGPTDSHATLTAHERCEHAISFGRCPRNN